MREHMLSVRYIYHSATSVYLTVVTRLFGMENTSDNAIVAVLIKLNIHEMKNKTYLMGKTKYVRKSTNWLWDPLRHHIYHV